MGTKWWVLIAPCLFGVAIGTVLVYPLIYSPRYDLLESHINNFETLPQFRHLAERHGLPHQIEEEHQTVTLTFPLDGTMAGGAVQLKFRDGRLRSALRRSQFGKWEPMICVKP